MSEDRNSYNFKEDCWIEFDSANQWPTHRETYVAGYNRGFIEATKTKTEAYEVVRNDMIKRFDPDIEGSYGLNSAVMREEPAGDYVRYADYSALAQELADLRAATSAAIDCLKDA